MTYRRRPKRELHGSDRRSASARTVVCLALCIVASPAFTQEELSAPEWRFEVGLGKTDNLNRDNEELESDIGKLALGFAGRTDRRWLRTALAGDIEYRKYSARSLSDDEDNDVLGSVDGELEMHALPDRVQWNFGVSYGQVRIDPLGAVGPSNRQYTTALSTGPEINLPLGERTLLRVGGMVSEERYEVTKELVGRSTSVRLALERQIDPVTQLALVAEDSETEYDLDGQIYNIDTLALEYQRELASGEAFASIGRGRVSVDDDSEPVTVARLVWKRNVGVRSQFEICYGREIADAGSAAQQYRGVGRLRGGRSARGRLSVEAHRRRLDGHRCRGHARL